MMISPIITPFRWYDKFYEQNRYDIDCAGPCEFKLLTDRSHLLPFQFKRTASNSDIDKWILRKACNAAEPKLLSPENSIFYGEYANTWTISGLDCGVRTIDTGSNRTLSDGSTRTIVVAYCQTAEKHCNILRSGSTSGTTASLLNILTIGKQYRLSITIGDLSKIAGSNLYLKFHNGTTTLVDNVNDLGYYEAEFTASSVDFYFEVKGDASTVGVTDYIGVEEVQIVELFNQKSDDIELDKTLVGVVNAGSVDYFIYLGDSLATSLPTGDYFSVITTLDGLVYYSEVITVSDFITNRAPHYILEWGNTCDINDVVYQQIDGRSYVNRLYLNEAVLTKPEYPFKEEGEEDGDKNFIATFQKWEKDSQFIIGKCPEFIVDALTGIRLHNVISLTKPVRKEQLQATTATTIKSVECEATYIINDCFANVNLKMLLEDKYVDSACCNNNTLTAIVRCVTCDITIGFATNDFTDAIDGHYAFEYTPLDDGARGNGLYKYNGSDWVLVIPTTNYTRVCLSDTSYVYRTDGGSWFITTALNSIFDTTGNTWHWKGSSYFGDTIAIERSIDGGVTWDDSIAGYPPVVGTSIQFASTGISVDMGGNLGSVCGVLIRAHNYNASCDYGYSNIYNTGSCV